MADGRCCCGLLSIQVGTTILALLSLIMSASGLIFYSVKGLNNTQDEGVAIPYLIENSLTFVAAILLLVGVWVGSSWMLIPYLIMMFLCIAMSILMFILVLSGAALVSTDVYGKRDGGLIAMYSIMQILAILISLWFFYVVFEAFRYLRSQETGPPVDRYQSDYV